MNPGASHGRRDRRYLLGAFLSSCIFAVAFAACGISIGADEEGTELFKDLTVEGRFQPGGELAMTLEYAQPYSVDVEIECVLIAKDPESTATPNATARPTNTPDKDAAPTAVSIPRVRPTPKNKVLTILEDEVPRNPQEVPPSEATPVVGTIVEAFLAPARPGRYVVLCLTPDDDNNAISETITISPGSTPTP